MFNQNKQSSNNQKAYLIQQIRATHQQATQKINQIYQLNNYNNKLLEDMDFGHYNGQTQKFPDKLTQDLGYIKKTCQIERKLIQKVKRLQKQIMGSHTRAPSQTHQFNQQTARLQKNVDNLTNEKRKKEQKLQQNQRNNQEMAQLRQDFNNLKKENKSLKNKNTQIAHQLRREKNKYQIFQDDMKNMNKRNKLTKGGGKRTIERYENGKIVQVIQSTLPPIVVNNDQIRNKKFEAIDMAKFFYQNNYANKHDYMLKQNGKLKQWLHIFIDSIERILMNRLQKLKQISGQNQQQLFTEYRYLNKMHFNGIIDFKQQYFPYSDMLYDFENIVKQSDKNKIQRQIFEVWNQKQSFNKQLVSKVVNQLRLFRTALINQFSQSVQIRKKIANQYNKIIHPNIQFQQIVSDISLQTLKQLSTPPHKFLNLIEQQQNKMNQYINRLQANMKQCQPQFLSTRIKLQQQTKLFCDQYKKGQNKQKQKQQVFQYLQQKQKQYLNNQYFKKIQQQNMNNLLQSNNTEISKQKKKEIQDKVYFQFAMKHIQNLMNQQKPTHEDILELSNKFREQIDEHKVKREYLDQFFRKNMLSIQGNEMIKYGLKTQRKETKNVNGYEQVQI